MPRWDAVAAGLLAGCARPKSLPDFCQRSRLIITTLAAGNPTSSISPFIGLGQIVQERGERRFRREPVIRNQRMGVRSTSKMLGQFLMATGDPAWNDPP
ncbi:hypothetical protein MAP00_003775 [Monascus purpureus]|nr:hypothetical protein MAP00_003775 [Monascus purpureus]